MEVQLFPLIEYWWFYLSFTAFVLLLLSLDLGVFHRKAHEVSMKEASIWTAVWIVLAMVFFCFLYWYCLWRFPQVARLTSIPGFDPRETAWRVSLEYLTGYIVEKSLSIDNIFIFVLIFSYFSTPPRYQHKVLFYGIIGALLFRALFIAAGSVLMQYHVVILLFGSFLVFTGIKMFFVPDKGIAPEKNPLLRLFRKIVPVASEFHGDRFFIRKEGILHATPLFVTLLFVETTDIVFAVDSVPAIFALTREPLIVFTSNIFAILGLRALYFLFAGAHARFYYLKYGLAIILIFVGLKMVWLNGLFDDGKFPIAISLMIICAIIAGSILMSLLRPKIRKKESALEAQAAARIPDKDS